MALKRNDNNIRDLRDECERLLSYHVILRMKDGTQYDGIIDDVNDDEVTVLVGEDVIEDDVNQQRKYRVPRRFRRFRRRRFPLGLLATLFLLDYPYLAPPYPY